jgi:hypothetical protein
LVFILVFVIFVAIMYTFVTIFILWWPLCIFVYFWHFGLL